MAYGLSYGNVGNASRRNRGIVVPSVYYYLTDDDDARVAMILGASRRVVDVFDWIKIHSFFYNQTRPTESIPVFTYLFAGDA